MELAVECARMRPKNKGIHGSWSEAGITVAWVKEIWLFLISIECDYQLSGIQKK